MIIFTNMDKEDVLYCINTKSIALQISTVISTGHEGSKKYALYISTVVSYMGQTYNFISTSL